MGKTNHNAFLLLIRKSAKKKCLFLPHAVRQMSRPDRMISPQEVKAVVMKGEIIEDYPNDPRGHSCLMYGKVSAHRTLHVVCSPKEEYLAIITAYLPSVDEWEDNFKKRKRS